MSTLIMYWDEYNIFGDPIAGIRIENAWANIQIPPNACGFRLGRPGEPWNGAWYFAPHGHKGEAFTHWGITYSSAFTGTSAPSAIEARGPVHGCAGGNGSYVFVTPLADFGVAGDAPVVYGAGSFVADFAIESDIEWLDSAGSVIEVELPEPHGGPAPLPPEFFEDPPTVKGCFRDFEGMLHCPEDADSAGAAATNPLPTGGIGLFIARNHHILPDVTIAEATTGRTTTVASGGKVEVHCPAELHLTATFFKSAGIDPAVVRYRFRFAHGPVSTSFNTLVDEPGANTVFHTVPIPLPKPIGPAPQGGVTPESDEFAVFEPPIDPPGGSGSSPISDTGAFELEPLPDNEHKGSVRVEVLNAAEGIFASGWATYHLVCVRGSGRPRLTPGLTSADVTSLQAAVNRWLTANHRDALKLDGRFGPRTEAAVHAFQEDWSLKADGIVGPRTWRKLLEFADLPTSQKARSYAYAGSAERI